MQRLRLAVRYDPLYGSLGIKGLSTTPQSLQRKPDTGLTNVSFTHPCVLKFQPTSDSNVLKHDWSLSENREYVESKTWVVCYKHNYVLQWPVPSFHTNTLSRPRLKCDGTRAETRFRLSAKRTCLSNFDVFLTVHLKKSQLTNQFNAHKIVL